MKTTATVLGIIAGIVVAIQAIPFFIASIAVAEFHAHDWYCGQTGGHMAHVQFSENRQGYLSEECQYPQP